MENIDSLYSAVVERLINSKLSITCMESMTGGYIASCITDVPGASAVFKGSYVSYSNEEKIRLGVDRGLIEKYTVYSEEVAIAMAETALAAFKADIAIGITGNAGNVDPANLTGIPGVVYIAVIKGKMKKNVIMNIDPSLARQEMKRLVAVRVAEEVLKME